MRTTSILRNTIFQVCVQIKNVKEKKNTQQATGYASISLRYKHRNISAKHVSYKLCDRRHIAGKKAFLKALRLTRKQC
jgi:hypothetical protein